uniref:Uncharacterized protein n=1 Tax=Oryza barthii TaxID=65489 RepID=A0A0D3G8C8_9ORYZ
MRVAAARHAAQGGMPLAAPPALDARAPRRAAPAPVTTHDRVVVANSGYSILEDGFVDMTITWGGRSRAGTVAVESAGARAAVAVIRAEPEWRQRQSSEGWSGGGGREDGH